MKLDVNFVKMLIAKLLEMSRLRCWSQSYLSSQFQNYSKNHLRSCLEISKSWLEIDLYISCPRL